MASTSILTSGTAPRATFPKNTLKRSIDALVSERAESGPSHSKPSSIIGSPDDIQTYRNLDDEDIIDPFPNTIHGGDAEITPEPKRIRRHEVGSIAPTHGLPMLSPFDLRLPSPDTQPIPSPREMIPGRKSFQRV